jgi:glycosyltransferase involved in cell wall biosynthesis
MHVKAFPLDGWGCGHYRMAWPVMAVDQAGLLSASVVKPDERKVALKLDVHAQPEREYFPVEEGDVAMFQRPTPIYMPGVIKLLQARGVAVVIDMDDDLAAVHPSNPAWLMMHPRSNNGHSWHHAAEACRLADLVTVTTPQLAQRYGAHGRVRVIPNCVPADALEIPHPDSAEIGWAGTVQTHPADLQQVGAAIARLVNGGVVFRTVGAIEGVAQALGLGRDPKSTGPVPFAQYMASIAQFGIGIAPLAMTSFNQAKSWLKPLEYSAVGVPWVGSPTEDYQRLHLQGCGVLADVPRMWEKLLRRLTKDGPWREELSGAGRDVAARWTFEGNAHRWAEAWADAAELRRLANDRPGRAAFRVADLEG